ncbi:LuxR C-terminal-related transcriptional regulator [Geodermatophilus sp. URMC 61]|uniref:LuxR C-terminal-related transcriptional regulator n=1 Tax=Geodermatophilus sp. URMC 61 TaxID=3423411 RepID=UPI00406D24C4
MDTWPFTGRDDELQVAVDAVVRRGCLVIAGAPGVGKSRLARELLARVGESGSGHGFVAATASSRDIPLAALASWTGTDAAVEPDVTAVQRATQTLRAGGPRWVLGVDDAHLLDEVSATVLQHLATERAILMVLTVRSGQSAPDAITALWKDGPAERLDLPPLAEAPTKALLRAVLDGPVDAATEHRFFEITRGNVLWLRHLVDGERRVGRLACTDGVWRWAGMAGLPPALSELVAEQIGVLTGAQARVLELLAFGEPLGLDQLNRLADPDAVEQVAQRGLAAVRRDGARWEVRIAHPLYAEAVRARVSSPRARRLRGELSEIVAGRRAGDGLRCAVLGLDSDTRPDPEVLVRAAGRAVGLTDYDLAERLYRAACDAGGGFEAQLGRSSVLSWVVRTREAEEALAAALASVATDTERLRAALFRAMLLFFHREDVDAARGVLDAAQTKVGTPLAVTVLDSMRATMAAASGDVEHAAWLAEHVFAGEGVPPWASAWASWGAVYARAWSGRGEPIADLVRRGIGVARATPETLPLQNNIAFAEVLGVCLEGEPARAGARTTWIREQPGSHAAGFSAMLEAYAEFTRGHPRTTVRLIQGVLPHLPGRGGGWTAFLAVLLASAQGMLGEAAAARAALELADRAAHPGIRFFDPHLGLGLAWGAAADGAMADARGHLARASALAHASGQSAVEVLVRHTGVCFGDRNQAPRLAELARELDGPAAPVAAAHARAFAAGDHAALMAVSAELEAAQRLVFAADAAAQAAVIARRNGGLPEAAAAAARAAELAERCGGPRTPALMAASSPLPFRDREREIALLAAKGLTNRAIADRLQLSVRTVESHVYRACTRLGLADRAALAAAVLPGTGAVMPGSGRRRWSAAAGGHES